MTRSDDPMVARSPGRPARPSTSTEPPRRRAHRPGCSPRRAPTGLARTRRSPATPTRWSWSPPCRTTGRRTARWCRAPSAGPTSPGPWWSSPLSGAADRSSTTCMTDVGNPRSGVVDGITFCCCPSRRAGGASCGCSVLSCRRPGSSRGRCLVMISCRSSRWSGFWRIWRRSRSRRTRSGPTRTI